MPDLGWLVPAAIALGAAALVTLIVVVAVRLQRRSPRARAAADRAVSDAARALLALDDALRDLDLAFEAADADEATDVPIALRRARATAHRARDRGFGDVLALEDDAGVAARRRTQAARVTQALEFQRESVASTRSQLTDWVAVHRTPQGLLAAARARRDELVAASGDPEPLIAALRARFDDVDWADAATAASAATDALAEADTALDRAAAEPTADHLLRATAAVNRAARHLRAVEDDHRVAMQAADNADAELAAARSEVEQALDVATSRPAACRPGAAERLRVAADALDDAAASASRRPREAIAVVATVREERDQLLDEAVSVRRRLEAARAALPGTLACARAALAAADARDAVPDEAGLAAPDGENRIALLLRLERARRHLAEARAATDAAAALAAARAAWAAVR
ncbi:hypothetical protein [Microbacterium enclense]|uniref:Uncharacterized protein n=1 Tax=Microbacterium enclense TaxID=993073 RepID=A0A1G6R275_9MICO|nr:hypothetical protein [Microbacterium enclense]KSU51712.1 hypothetical protein AS029_15690 [Microbacterium enclense]SDC98648.1 hypothetical protein SAMN05216418_0009 [Microbacterium enclense]